MGKKAKFKKLRRIASAMPIIQTKHVVGKTVTGQDVLDKGIKEVNGEPVLAAGKYREKTVEKVPLNHKRKMKQLYYMNGMNGVRQYMQAVKQYAAKNA